MTPKQLRDMNWAIVLAEDEMRQVLKHMYDGSETEKRIVRAKFAIACAWSEYRASRIARRTASPKRDLQRVRAK